MLSIKPITNKILHITADSQQELNEAFLRFSEYEESPEWKGKIFTVGQYRKWYAETFGAFSYLTDWSGFNLTNRSFAPFIQGLFDPLTPGEEQMVKWLRDRTDTYSVIGSQPGSDSLEHEICHALWATEPKYKELCQEVVKKIDKNVFDALCLFLTKIGYNESVHDDEVHAYCSSDRAWLMEKHGIVIDEAIQSELLEIKKQFYQPKR
jgi:hypothetical protein